MNYKPKKIESFINKLFSIKQNAFWKAENYAKSVASAASHNTYLETVNSETMPNADTLHYRIQQDVNLNMMSSTFMDLTKQQLKRFRYRRVVVIIDYTHESFFGKTQNDWIHGYRPASGSHGCYKFLAVSILADSCRHFVYAKPISLIADETLELWQMLAKLKSMQIRIECLLIDRGIARNSENLALFKDMNVRYLGLYQKYRNIKKVINEMKRKTVNRKFKVRGVPTRLVIGRKKFTWVFVSDIEFDEFDKYLKLYKKRWNIETGFRMQDEAQIKTKSTDVRVRFFLFIIALLLYNCWKSSRMKIPFKRFVIELQRGVECEAEKPT
jgi:hypothetical protein